MRIALHPAMMRVLAVGMSLCATVATAVASSENDRVVRSVLSPRAPIQSSVRIWYRASVEDDLDLVVALVGSEAPYDDGSVTLNQLGILLQERERPFRAFVVTVSGGPPGCAATLLRATSTDVVVRCEEEKSSGPILKFVYDIRAKRLVGSFRYERYWMTGAKVVGSPGRRRARIVGHSGTERVTFEFSGGETPIFRVVGREVVGERPASDAGSACGPFGPSNAFQLVTDESHFDGEYRAVESRFGGERRTYRLPVSTRRDYVKARLMRTPKNDAHGDDNIDEWIGPCQVVDGRLWFGRTFYDGESQSGVGGVGYFSPQDARFTLFTGDVIADWSATALRVESDAAWLALETAGESGAERGGIVRFDRRTQTFQRVTSGGGIGRQFVRLGEDLLLVTDGVSVVRDGRATHFIVDRTTDGRLRVVESMR